MTLEDVLVLLWLKFLRELAFTENIFLLLFPFELFNIRREYTVTRLQIRIVRLKFVIFFHDRSIFPLNNFNRASV